MLYWIGILLYGVSGYTVHGGLLVRPQNTEVVVGESVRLRCSTSDIYNVNWEHFPTAGSAPKKNYVFFAGGMIIPYHRRFSVDRGIGKSGQFDLVISSVELSDAGRYRCSDREGQGEHSEAELVVLASIPQCNAEEFIGENSCAVAKKEDIQVYCFIQYSGNVVPSLICSNFSTFLVKSDVILNPGNASYSFVLKPEPQIIASPHTCYTSLSSISSDEFNISVTYVVESQTRMIINQRTQLTCTANSTTSCSYKWIGANGNITSTNRTTGIEVPGKYRCEAECLIQGNVCTVQCLEVTYEAIEENSTTITILVLVLIISLLLLIAITSSVIILRRHRKRRSAVTLPPPAFELEHDCVIPLKDNEYSSNLMPPKSHSNIS